MGNVYDWLNVWVVHNPLGWYFIAALIGWIGKTVKDVHKYANNRLVAENTHLQATIGQLRKSLSAVKTEKATEAARANEVRQKLDGLIDGLEKILKEKQNEIGRWMKWADHLEATKAAETARADQYWQYFREGFSRFDLDLVVDQYESEIKNEMFRSHHLDRIIDEMDKEAKAKKVQAGRAEKFARAS